MNAETQERPDNNPWDNHDCEEDGHDWHFIRVVASFEDSAALYRCSECGKERVE